VLITKYGQIQPITYKIYPALSWNRAQEESPNTAQSVVDNSQIYTLVSIWSEILAKFMLNDAANENL
jgi:hypothetical protein